MRHESLPMTMTPEQLADYIRSNRIATKNHIEKIYLTEEEKRDLAVKSSLASRAILRLENLSKLIKKGTPWDTNLGKDGDHQPVDITIPPTAGIDVLKSNRQYADDQIEKGFREEVTAIYFLPWPEYEKIVAVCIEGKEWSTYSRDMNAQEKRQHGKPILSAAQSVKELLEDNGISVERVDGKEVSFKVDESKKNKRKKNLLEDDGTESTETEDFDENQPV
jgi:hypothetical protein